MLTLRRQGGLGAKNNYIYLCLYFSGILDLKQ